MEKDIEKKKSLYDISWQCSEEEYRADKAYSYSTLSRYEREGFSKLENLFDPINTPYTTFGSLVDCLLFDGINAVNNRFALSTLPEISDSLVEIANKLHSRYSEMYLKFTDIPDDILTEVGVECGYYKDPKYKTYRLKLIKEGCNNYYQVLQSINGKLLVSIKDWEDAKQCVNVIKGSQHTKDLLIPNEWDDDVEILYQLKFKGNYLNYDLRCMADALYVDHKNKFIIPIDLKTTSKKAYNFPESFLSWRYMIQAQLYWYIIRQNMDKDEYFKDFILMEYKFVVINRHDLIPIIWDYPDTKSIIDLEYNGEIYRNWRSIVEELDYYLKHRPSLPKSIHLNNNNIVNFLNKT